MNRRQFMTLLGGAAAAWPMVARGQQSERVRRIGVLMGGADNPGIRPRLAAFLETLGQLGWIEGRNMELDIRWGANDAGRVLTFARDLVQQKPDAILAGPTNALLPLAKQTRTIPIVFVQVSDPLGQGIVESLARPTGNLTGSATSNSL